MKISALFIAAVYAQSNTTDTDIPEDDVWYSGGQQVGSSVARSGGRLDSEDKRYIDLHGIAKKIWQKAGLKGKAKFDERKYWAYGCHCFLLGDRPMSEMGKGAPVDALDVRCKAYKDCQKCVRQKHGDECIGEFKSYQWSYKTKTKSFVSRDPVDSCEQDLFQCDLKLAQDTFEMRETYNTDYHAFWSTLPNGFDYQLGPG